MSGFRFFALTAVAVAVGSLAAAPARAGGIGFQSQVPIAVIVQGASAENNVLRRGAPVLILPGKVGWDLNLKPGARLVTIYDSRQATRVLYQGYVPFRGRDVIFAIRPVPGNLFRVQVVPITPP